MRQNSKKCTTKRFLCPIILLIFSICGCGQDEHEPYVTCLNFGQENVRRNIKIRAQVFVGRPPLNNVSSETVKLFKLPQYEQVAGVVQYGGGNQIVFIPSRPLDDSTRYRFEITDGITDKSGKSMRSFYVDFMTGKAFQIYYCDLLYDYDSFAERVYSIALYFTESVNQSNLISGIGYISVSGGAFPLGFSISYYDQIACAILHFSPYLEMGETYRLEVGPYIYSLDGTMFDGDRDGEWQDLETFVIIFKYGKDSFGEFGIAESTTIAAPYTESSFGCIFYALD